MIFNRPSSRIKKYEKINSKKSEVVRFNLPHVNMVARLSRVWCVAVVDTDLKSIRLGIFGIAKKIEGSWTKSQFSVRRFL